MIHVVFNRPMEKLKVFDQNGSLVDVFEASGDAWGDGVSGPYGFEYPMPPGHYLLTSVQRISPALASEGAGQIPVVDLDQGSLNELVAAGKANGSASALTVGGITLATGGLQACKRDGIMIHGGGSNLAKLRPPQDPLAPMQGLCKTYGCTRMHNANLATLMTFLAPLFVDDLVVFSAIGDPVPLAF